MAVRRVVAYGSGADPGASRDFYVEVLGFEVASAGSRSSTRRPTSPGGSIDSSSRILVARSSTSSRTMRGAKAGSGAAGRRGRPCYPVTTVEGAVYDRLPPGQEKVLHFRRRTGFCDD